MTRIEWMSDHGVRFILRIEDGSDTDTDLVPGATPFVTTIDTDDDLPSVSVLELVNAAFSVAVLFLLFTHVFASVSLYDGTRIFYKTSVSRSNVRRQTRRSDAHLMNSDFMTLRFFPHMTSGKSFRRMI